MLVYTTPEAVTAFSTTRDGDAVFPAEAQLFIPYHQMHGTKMRVIDEKFLKMNALQQSLMLTGIDALCTDQRNVCVCVKTADCIPVLIWDEDCRVVAAVHAGWKGTMKRIAEHSIDELCATYSVDSHRLHAIIGPGIGFDSFEIGNEVFDMFAQQGFDMGSIAKQYPCMRGGNEQKWHIDLWECNRQQLVAKGLDASNIHIAGIDTFAQHTQFFSARHSAEGRIINGIMLN